MMKQTSREQLEAAGYDIVTMASGIHVISVSSEDAEAELRAIRAIVGDDNADFSGEGNTDEDGDSEDDIDVTLDDDDWIAGK